ncbi:hypothetical protein D0B54_05005 [Solimonas sp. K1W22B-7]|nr:hypothetical protein D0B54_05005 [Solimonas sp. K1W22B-7]
MQCWFDDGRFINMERSTLPCDSRMQSLEQLDSEELFRLALLDVQAARHDLAIVKLKQVISLEPRDARAHFMLAAEHAELGLFDRAEEGMLRALAIEPALHTARFQLGLLQYTRNDFEKARATWKDLEALGAGDPLNLFKTALLSIQTGDLKQAVEELEDAHRLSGSNPALGNDIAKVLANVRAKLTDMPVTTPYASEKSSAAAGAGLLHRYGDSLDSQ